ncbi:MAG: hypothetical protein FH762_15770 [Firmicutes bacterium]|nr:hypothetical protein [Bacillota bacterium]
MTEDNAQDISREGGGLNNIAGIEGDSFEFLLFLILILLIMGNSNTFNSYFEVLDGHVKEVNNILNLFSSTANGLKGAFTASQQFN